MFIAIIVAQYKEFQRESCGDDKTTSFFHVIANIIGSNYFKNNQNSCLRKYLCCCFTQEVFKKYVLDKM
jgi:hypothetical protein